MGFYRERYASQGFRENAVYPGMEAALGELRSRGLALFVATSKPAVYAGRILEHFGLRHFFSAVYGSELDGTRSSKAQLLAYLLDRECLVPAETVVVGDRAQDVQAALAHRIRPLGALWGYGSREELAAAGAVAFCERPCGLPACLS